jgi:hypothetical protein
MLPLVAPTPQDPRQGEHHRGDPNNDEHMVEINMIFGDSISITSSSSVRSAWPNESSQEEG